MPKKQALEIGKNALAHVGLADRCNYYPYQLSGGMQQRVGIARAIAVNPDIILFDEPTSSLDPELVGEVLTTIKRLAREGITMLIVTHEMLFAREVATNVMFMSDGKILESGTAEDFFKHPKNERTREFLRRTSPDYDYAI
jgi:L-cystine transport system ATP-binding protein